jgi:hypothetical protein
MPTGLSCTSSIPRTVSITEILTFGSLPKSPFLTRHLEQSLEKISGVVGFISESSLHPVVETFILELGRWYTRHSLIYVSNNHPVWEREKKPGKRFGNLRRSSASTINTMMEAHQAEVEEFLETTGQFLQDNISALNAEGSTYGSTMMTRTGSAGSRTIG